MSVDKNATSGAWLGKMGAFRSWCLEKGLVITKKEKPKRKETHLLLDGGKLCVPETTMADFYEMYHTACFCQWERLYVVEMKSDPFFAMLAEIDFKFERELSNAEVIAVVKSMQSGIKLLAQGLKVDTRCVVLTTTPDKCKDGNGIKTGIHVVWRDLIVDLETANLFRTAMRLQLQQAEVESLVPKPLESWSNTLDPAVFDKNGLRMIRSRKAGVCSECKGKSAEAMREKGRGQQCDPPVYCSGCQNQGKVDLGRPYDLFCAMNENGDVDLERTEKLRADTRGLLDAATVRHVQSKLDRSRCLTKNCFDSDRTIQLQREREREKKGCSAAKKATQPPIAQATPAASAPAGKQRVPLKDILPSDEKFKVVAALIKEKVGSPDLTHLKQSSIGDLYFANTSCRFCPNKNGEHASSTNFFVIKVTGIQRRCYCTKPDQRGSDGITCRAWASKLEELPLNVAQTLFSKKAIERRKVLLQLERGQSAIMREGPPKRQLEPDTATPAYQMEMTPERLLSRIERQGGFKLPRPLTPAAPGDQPPPVKRRNSSKSLDYVDQDVSSLYDANTM